VKILFLSSSSGSRGGGEIFLLYLGAALKSGGHTVGLWTSRHPRMDELAEKFARIGEVWRGNYRNTYDQWHRGVLTSHDPDVTRELAAICAAWRPDVLHVNKQNLEDGNDLLAAATQLSVPHLCTVHITQPARFLGARFAAWRDRAARKALQSYRAPLVAVAPTRVDELRAFLGPAADVRLVVNGVPPSEVDVIDRDALRASEGISPGAFAVVAVGRLEPQKRPLRFLDHAQHISQAIRGATFSWIGDGRMAQAWDETVQRRDLAESVRRVGWRDDVRRVLPAYDFFLHCAAYEGLPLALLEAMDAGLPCAIEVTVHRQLPAPLQSCAIAIEDSLDWRAVLADCQRLRDLGQRAQQTVRAEFSTAAMARGYEKIYAGLLGRR
jgi:glycosyltransferase involved in cell wall biosynthesis